jgi:hypothetical protein
MATHRFKAASVSIDDWILRFCHSVRFGGFENLIETKIMSHSDSNAGRFCYICRSWLLLLPTHLLCIRAKRGRRDYCSTVVVAVPLNTTCTTHCLNVNSAMIPDLLGLSRIWFCVCCLVTGAWFTWRSFSYVSFFLTVGCLIWIVRITFIRRAFKRGCEFGVRALVVLGSGGHTAEMMTMMSSLAVQKMQFRSILYAVAATDGMSRFKAENSGIRGDFVVVPRAREVGQSFISSALTTAWAFVHSFICVMRYQPQLFLCNGPGTCVPFAIAVCICRLAVSLLVAQPLLCVLFIHRSDQVFRTVSLLHRVRRVFCARQDAVSFRSHHVLRRRQVCCSVGRTMHSLSARNLCGCLVLTAHAV